MAGQINWISWQVVKGLVVLLIALNPLIALLILAHIKQQ